MKSLLPLWVVLAAFLDPCAQAERDWPQAGGPDASWSVVDSNAEAPRAFSVARDEHILWKLDLPEGGQSGLCISGDRLFLTVLEPVTANTVRKKGSNLLCLCVDLENHAILWQRKLEGSLGSTPLYGFSDSSSPTPLTDGKHVWFVNASGAMACYDFAGELQWEHRWSPTDKQPFNKQFEPLLSGDLVINMEPYGEDDGIRTQGWNYLVAYNKTTGGRVWISEDALTHYNTPVLSKTKDDKDAVLIGRGGHHGVPETPIGYSMIDSETGKALWRYAPENGKALYNAVWNREFAVWMTYDGEIHVLNSETGALIRKISLHENVSLQHIDSDTQQLVSRDGVNIPTDLNAIVFPAWFSNVLLGDQLIFMCFEAGRFKKTAGPRHCVARVNLRSGRVEYFQVPTSIDGEEKRWNETIGSDTSNARGLDIAGDPRSKRDGWHWNFNANPIAVNSRLYYTLMNGRVYVLDANAKKFNQHALLSLSDLGAPGETWSLTTPSYASGKLYHRSLDQLICIGE